MRQKYYGGFINSLLLVAHISYLGVLRTKFERYKIILKLILLPPIRNK